MSFCRWSSDDHSCDVYVYADVAGGFTTHVAGRRIVWNDDVTLPPPVDLPIGERLTDERKAWVDATFDRQAAVAALIDDESNWTWLDLPSPPAGATFNHATGNACADNLEWLASLGLNVPDYAIRALRAEDDQ